MGGSGTASSLLPFLASNDQQNQKKTNKNAASNDLFSVFFRFRSVSLQILFGFTFSTSASGGWW